MTTTQRNRRLGMGLGLLIALAVVLWLIFGGHRYVTTENAYIKIDMISLTADVSGPLVAVNARCVTAFFPSVPTMPGCRPSGPRRAVT